jgi:membrane associated rhomboid family serine protease
MHLTLLLLIGIIVLTSLKGFNDLSFFRKYEFHIGSIRAGDNVRMFSSAFLHGDWGHLFFNMFTLYMFAPVVISYFDSFSFLVIYFGSLVFGSLLTLLFHKDEYSYRAIGASGAVTGILYSAILLHPDMSLYLFFIPIPIPAYLFGPLYLFFEYYSMKKGNTGIAHDAHIGGAIFGILFVLMLDVQKGMQFVHLFY